MQIFIIIGLIIILPFALASLSLAPWVPSATTDLPRIFSMFSYKKGEIFYDLGSGNGQVVFYASKHGLAARGIEMSFWMYIYSQIKKYLTDNNKSQLILGNLFNKDLSDADIVFVYGMPKILKNRLRVKLEKELKNGARVISYAFPIDGLAPIKIDRPTKKDLPIYLYIM